MIDGEESCVGKMWMLELYVLVFVLVLLMYGVELILLDIVVVSIRWTRTDFVYYSGLILLILLIFCVAICMEVESRSLTDSN